MIAEDAIASRRSVRAFLPDPVPEEIVERILALAARAPSGTNIQPWRVHVLTGAARDGLVPAVCRAYDTEPSAHAPEYDYYPKEFFESYLSRRRKVGWDLYGLLGIAKGDKAAMSAQHRRNFEFFGAPVGLMITLDRRFGRGSWLDCGMFMQNLMIAARAGGLDTCAEAAWIQFHRIIAQRLGLAEHEMLVCGMALGHCTGKPSSRKIERATYDDVPYRVLAANQHPDHDTLAAFRQEHLQALAGLFLQVLGSAKKPAW